jgi:hypothetical protein
MVWSPPVTPAVGNALLVFLFPWTRESFPVYTVFTHSFERETGESLLKH